MKSLFHSCQGPTPAAMLHSSIFIRNSLTSASWSIYCQSITTSAIGTAADRRRLMSWSQKTTPRQRRAWLSSWLSKPMSTASSSQAALPVRLAYYELAQVHRRAFASAVLADQSGARWLRIRPAVQGRRAARLRLRLSRDVALSDAAARPRPEPFAEPFPQQRSCGVQSLSACTRPERTRRHRRLLRCSSAIGCVNLSRCLTPATLRKAVR